jgi:hypothetical protein
LVEANSQHRPDEAWFVIGAPSVGILMLNWWVSEMVAAREERTAVAGFELSARRASRFCTCRQLLQTCDEWLVVPWGPP